MLKNDVNDKYYAIVFRYKIAYTQIIHSVMLGEHDCPIRANSLCKDLLNQDLKPQYSDKRKINQIL